MSENYKKFLEAVSGNEALFAKLSEEKDIKVYIAAAKELGITLTEADFDMNSELSDDDLDDVAGGTGVSCSCAVGGGGTKDENDKTCACVVGGAGYTKKNVRRCLCALGGYGYDY